MYNSNELASQIKLIAKMRKKIIKDMLNDCGLGSNTMSGLYHGKSIAFDSLAKIADYLDCSVDYLLGRTDEVDISRSSVLTASSALTIEEQEALEAFRSLSDKDRFEFIVRMKQRYEDYTSEYKDELAKRKNEGIA